MSLREFHIVFITASILLSLGFAAWGFVQYNPFHGFYAGAAVLSLITAFGLMGYGLWFIKKTKA